MGNFRYFVYLISFLGKRCRSMCKMNAKVVITLTLLCIYHLHDLPLKNVNYKIAKYEGKIYVFFNDCTAIEFLKREKFCPLKGFELWQTRDIKGGEKKKGRLRCNKGFKGLA